MNGDARLKPIPPCDPEKLQAHESQIVRDDQPPTEIPLKAWLRNEAEWLNLTPEGVWQRLKRGKYPHVKLRRVNKRVIFVQI